MIIVRNREMIIPRDEFNIGTSYDTHSETRIFHIDRVTGGGVDVSSLDFHLDLQYADGNTDTCLLTKEFPEDENDFYFNLIWTIISSMLQVPGTVIAQIRALDGDGNCKWASYVGAFFVEDAINVPAKYTGDLSELEQYETAETARVKAEGARETAEAARVKAEGARESQFSAAITAFNTDRQELADYATTSKSYSVGGTGNRDGEDTDNAKYYSEQAEESEANAKKYYDEVTAQAEVVKAAETAAENAQKAADTVQAKLDAGDFKGDAGTAATIAIGTVSTGAPGSIAKVVNSGTESNAILDFTIPQGQKGETVTDASTLNTSSITESSDMYPTYTSGEYMQIILGKIAKYLNDLKQDKVANFTISSTAASWVSQTINDATYYVYTQAISAVYTDTPDVMLAPSSGMLPTSAEETAYGKLIQVTVDPDALTLKLYASAVPKSNFVISVRGVS